ncbi:18130_t:CDS:1, partial [Funneliformis geosporum]
LIKARIVSDHIALLSNPLENIKIEFEEESKDENIDRLLYKNKRIKIDNMNISNILPITSKEKRKEKLEKDMKIILRN